MKKETAILKALGKHPNLSLGMLTALFGETVKKENSYTARVLSKLVKARLISYGRTPDGVFYGLTAKGCHAIEQKKPDHGGPIQKKHLTLEINLLVKLRQLKVLPEDGESYFDSYLSTREIISGAYAKDEAMARTMRTPDILTKEEEGLVAYEVERNKKVGENRYANIVKKLDRQAAAGKGAKIVFVVKPNQQKWFIDMLSAKNITVDYEVMKHPQSVIKVNNG